MERSNFLNNLATLYGIAPFQKAEETKELASDHDEEDGDVPEIEKGGEGSKGGHVIGHTKTGKPIYDSHGHEGHKDFTKEDHDDAAGLHLKKLNSRFKSSKRDYLLGKKTKDEFDNDSVYQTHEVNRSKHFYQGSHAGDQKYYQPTKF